MSLARAITAPLSFARQSREGVSAFEHLGQSSASAASKLSHEAMDAIRLNGTHTAKAPTQLELFPDIALPTPKAALIAKAETDNVVPMRRIFIALDNPHRNLDFNHQLVGSIRVKEVYRDGSLSGSKSLTVHHMNEAGTTYISPLSMQRLSSSDLVATCHPESLSNFNYTSQILPKHVMPEAKGKITMRRPDTRVLDPESGRYGHLIDIINEPFKARYVKSIEGQLSLPFERKLHGHPPEGYLKKANPWQFTERTNSVWM